MAVSLIAESAGLQVDCKSVRACALHSAALPPELPTLVFGENSVNIIGTLCKTLLNRATRSFFALGFAVLDSYLRFLSRSRLPWELIEHIARKTRL